MMDWLYDELEPAERARFDEHVQDCTRCFDELASLAKVRTMFRDFPEMEPPAASAAVLMHEAGKRAPARARGDQKEGLWAWLTGFFAPVLAHPALAAAASLILVVTVAGSLYMRGKSQYAEPTLERTPGTSPAGEITAAEEATPGDTAWPAGAEGAASEGGDYEDSDRRAEKPDPQELARDGARSQAVARAVDDSLAQELADKTAATVPVDTPRRELSLKDLADTAPRADRGTAKRDLAPRSTPRQAPAPRGKSATSPSTSVAATTTETRTADMAEADDESAAYDGLVSQNSAPATSTGRQAPAAGAGLALDSARKKTETKTATKTDTKAAKKKAAKPQAPPPAAMAEPEAAASRAPTYRSAGAGKGNDQVELAWARARHRSLLEAIGKKQCRDAARIAVDILDRNPGYYHGTVERSRELKSCQQYVAEERRTRARSRSKAADRGAAGAQEAAPAKSKK
jgi:hypothetical protein